MIPGVPIPTFRDPYMVLWGPTENCPALDPRTDPRSLQTILIGAGDTVPTAALSALREQAEALNPGSSINGQYFPGQGGRPAEYCTLAEFPTPFRLANATRDRAALASRIYDQWDSGTPALPGGLWVASVDGANATVEILLNESFTGGQDLPFFSDLAYGALTRLAVPSSSGVRLTALAGFPTEPRTPTLDLSSLLGPLLYLFALQSVLPVALGAVVREKELRIREIMVMMGLRMPVYWVVTYSFYLALFAAAATFMVAATAVLGFRFFVANEFGPYALLLFLWGNTMVALALCASTLFRKARTATLVGYLYVIASSILAAQLVEQYFADEGTSEAVKSLFCLVPTFALYRGLLIISRAVFVVVTANSRQRVRAS